MRLNLNEIKAFSKCPRYYSFLKSGEMPISLRNKIIEHIIKKCYSRQSENNYFIPWRTVLGWIDKAIFHDIDVSLPESYEKAKQLSNSIVEPLHHWYQEEFKKEEVITYINIPAKKIIGGCEIYETIPIVKMTDPITIVTIDDAISSEIQMFNDIKTRGLAWLLTQELKVDTIVNEHLLIGKLKRLEILKTNFNKEMNKKIQQTIEHIAAAIRIGVSYASISSACNTCPYKTECVL